MDPCIPELGTLQQCDVYAVCIKPEPEADRSIWCEGETAMAVKIYSDCRPYRYKFRIPGTLRDNPLVTQKMIDGDYSGPRNALQMALRGVLRLVTYNTYWMYTPTGMFSSDQPGGCIQLVDSDMYLIYSPTGRFSTPRMVLAPTLAKAYGLKPPPGAPKPAKQL